jgi:hypothetical protein
MNDLFCVGNCPTEKRERWCCTLYWWQKKHTEKDTHMKMMSFERFAADFGRAVKPTMNMSDLRDTFQCSCGQSHWFDERIDRICDGFQKVMVSCPNDPSYVTSLKIKTFMIVKFKGFESLAGSRIASQEEKVLVLTMRAVLRNR